MQTSISQLFSTPTSTNKLQKEALKDVDLKKYPANCNHYLAYALQNNTKLPSQKSMARSEMRNQKKNGLNKADKVVGRRRAAPVMNIYVRNLRYGSFTLPNRFGPQPIKVQRRNRGVRAKGFEQVRGMEKLLEKWPVKPLVPRVPKKKKEFRQPLSLPVEVVKKTKKAIASKSSSICFKIRSTQWVAQKSERTTFCSQIEKFRAEKIKEEKIQREANKEVPLYFRKKKDSQKRRRQEKHELIKKNRKALVAIFGDAIFKRGWPISRKEIRLALGIKEGEQIPVEQLEEFMEMAEVGSTFPEATENLFDGENDFPSLLQENPAKK